MELKIDPEFHALIPPLSSDEYVQLEANLKAEGCREPLIIWEEGNILIDGHNRFEICNRIGIPFKTTLISLPGRLEARIWIRTNQAGRRNLTDDQRAMNAIELQEDLSKLAKRERGKVAGQAGGNAGGRGRKKKIGLSVTAVSKPIETKTKKDTSKKKDTRKAVSKRAGVSERKMRQAKQVKEKSKTLSKQVLMGDVPLALAVRALRKEEKEAKRRVAIEEGKKIKDETVFCLSIEEVYLEPNSVDLIVTDPPYDDQHIEHYAVAAKLAESVLKPGRFFCCYAGKLRLPEVINAVTPYLEWIWEVCTFHSFSKEKHLGPPYNFAENWRPVLIFKKAGKTEVCNFQQDVVRAERDKTFHDWQQDLKTPLQLIEAYTEPGDLVLDPFCGGGTTLVASKQLGRKWMGFDISEDSVALSKRRLYGEN